MPELELRGPTPEAETAAPDGDDGPSPIGAHHVPEPQLFNIKWGELSGQELHDTINRIYDDVIHWSQNLFLVPLGATGSLFVKELARLFQAFADGGPMERMSMKAITVFQILMLQKSSRSSRRKNDAKHLQRRLDLWQQGKFVDLFEEGMCLQKRLPKSPRLTSNVSATTLTSHTFRNLMEKGKVKNALRYLSSDQSGGILRMEDSVPVTNRNGDVIDCSVRDVLVEKHPNGKPASPSALLPFTPSHVNPILFDHSNLRTPVSIHVIITL